ncbi:MAG: hypothetical protein AB8B51_03355 [Sedimentitalea sp.]
MDPICTLKSLTTALSLLGFCLEPAHAESGKFYIDGTTLIYDTDTPNEDEYEGIKSADINILLDLLRDNDGIQTLQLNSNGGSVWASFKMSDIILDFELDTHVHGDCDSSCVTLLLAGQNRTMSRGSRLGFHQTYWSAKNIESYYNDNREDDGWDTPFDFAEWMYLDTQDEVYNQLKYMLSRDVDPVFAIESIRDPDASMWRPRRSELLRVGVLTE